jgi:ribosome-associated heat shock protein Hsp15
MRVDKWLWAARFFKTRSIANDAIAKNRVRVGGQRIKPSRSLQIGDTVQIEKPPYVFDVTVLGLNDKRRPASEASLLYQESDESIAAREELAMTVRANYQMQSGLAGSGRPSKKQRRQIIRFQNQHDVTDDDTNG